MKSTGYALKERAFVGGVAPPDTFEDEARGNDGVHTNITWVKNPAGLWVRSFNGSNSRVVITDNPSIQNLFDGGGTAIVWINPASDGISSLGRIFDKGGILEFFVREEDGNKVKLQFNQDFGGANGQWRTDATEITLNTMTMVAVTYDNDSDANDPTLYINTTAKTVGDGLTEAGTPAGTRDTDAGNDLVVGNRLDTARAFDGYIALPIFLNYALSIEQIAAIYQEEKRWFK